MDRVKVKVVMETLALLFVIFFFKDVSLLIVSKSMGILNPIN